MLWIFWWIPNWFWIIKDLRLILDPPFHRQETGWALGHHGILVGLQLHMPTQVFGNTEKRTETGIYYVFWSSKVFGPSAVPTPYYNSSTFGLATSWKILKWYLLTNAAATTAKKTQMYVFIGHYFHLLCTIIVHSARGNRIPMYFLMVMKTKITSLKKDMSRPQLIQNTYLSI